MSLKIYVKHDGLLFLFIQHNYQLFKKNHGTFLETWTNLWKWYDMPLQATLLFIRRFLKSSLGFQNFQYVINIWGDECNHTVHDPRLHAPSRHLFYHLVWDMGGGRWGVIRENRAYRLKRSARHYCKIGAHGRYPALVGWRMWRVRLTIRN
jgi:hypothetical protein